LLGVSYNIKRKFLGKHAIVLGASPISGGESILTNSFVFFLNSFVKIPCPDFDFF